MHSFYSEHQIESEKTTYSLKSLHSNPLSDYIILSPLGRGAASFVYKIQCRKTKKELALKVIDKKQGNFNVLSNRLKNEIKVHSELNHENIIKLLDSFEDSDNFYILLELCGEGEFYSYIKAKGRLEEDEIRNYGMQLAKALKYLHDNKVLHRDIKLGNLLLSRDKILKLCDFGLAVKLNDERPERDTLCGTPNYISPEIINKINYGYKSDCWAFGCILYALTTGHPPFEGDSVQKTLQNVKKGSFQIPTNISPDFQDLLKNIITWDSDKRYNMNQILNHTFFIGNKFSFCVPSNYNNQINNNTFTQKNDNSKNLVSTPELVKTTEKTNIDIKPRRIFQNQDILKSDQNQTENKTNLIKNCKGVSNSVGSKAFLQNFGGINHNLKHNAHKPSFDTKENLCIQPNLKPKNVSKENNKNFMNSINNKNRNEKTLVNKSIEILKPEDNNELEKYLKTEIDQTPKGKKTSKNIPNNSQQNTNIYQNQFFKTPRQFNMNEKNFNPGFLLLSNNNNVKININTSKILNTTNNNEEKIKIISSSCSISNLLMPLSTINIKPCKFQTKNGAIEIKNDQTLQMEIANGKMLLLITSDGKRVFIAKRNDGKFNKNYSLTDLPQKYHIYYNYAKKVCETLKQAPLAKISNEVGKFSLTKNSIDMNFLNFEAIFLSGYRVYYQIGGNTLSLTDNSGEEMEVDIKEKLNKLNKDVQKIVRISLNYMEECIRIYERSKEELSEEK